MLVLVSGDASVDGVVAIVVAGATVIVATDVVAVSGPVAATTTDEVLSDRGSKAAICPAPVGAMTVTATAATTSPAVARSARRPVAQPVCRRIGCSTSRYDTSVRASETTMATRSRTGAGQGCDRCSNSVMTGQCQRYQPYERAPSQRSGATEHHATMPLAVVGGRCAEVMVAVSRTSSVASTACRARPPCSNMGSHVPPRHHSTARLSARAQATASAERGRTVTHRAALARTGGSAASAPTNSAKERVSVPK